MDLSDKIQCVRLYSANEGNCNAVRRHLYNLGIESGKWDNHTHMDRVVPSPQTISYIKVLRALNT